METELKNAIRLYALEGYDINEVIGHEGGRNRIYVCSLNGVKDRILRISCLPDRSYEDYLAETEFVHYLAHNAAPAADVLPSVNGKLVERIELDNETVTISLFEYAKGILLCDNGYRYREGAPLDEYFYNVGKALGRIHELSKRYMPQHKRPSYFEKYNKDYIDSLIPEEYAELKAAIFDRLERFRMLPTDESVFGLVHFDYSDGNYHIDMETGDITVFDFDNCMYCWYMFDLADLWTHLEGWGRGIKDPTERILYLEKCFETILSGYRSETTVPDLMLDLRPLFVDMVLIENIVDEFECCAREEEELDYEDIEAAAEALIGSTNDPEVKLKEGNLIYCVSEKQQGDVSNALRIRTANEGQHPYAVIITCSDSRVIPESVFSTGIGELFVIRTAGSVIDLPQLGSIEYALDHLGTKLVVLMGHTQCGAIGAAMDGHAEGFAGSIIHGIREAIGDERDEYAACVKNVRYGVKRIFEKLITEKREDVKVRGAVYHIDSGIVEFL
ncbi:MAG: phosphotransferase [Clostridia bacterium]|nr:phosphotransferase [Clostridia bacterium]